MSLLMLGSILASSVAVGTLVARGIRANREVDDASRAYYAAESGVERGLWQIKEHPLGAAEAVDTTEDVVPSDDADIATHVHRANRGSIIVIPHIASGASYSIDLYHTNGFSVASPGAGVSSLSWSTREGDVRVTCSVWSYTHTDGVQFVPCAATTVEGMTLLGLHPENAYRVTFTPSGATDAEQVAIMADGGATTLPTPLRIESLGVSPRNQQALSIEVPGTSPLTPGAIVDMGDGTLVNTKTGETVTP